jgi:opacity protein-like surface antigen
MKKIQDRDPPGEQVRGCRSVSAALLLAVLFSLVSPLPGHAQEDLHRAVPPPGKALIFVFRADRDPVAERVPVVVNNETVGQLANGTFVAATVNPGTTHLRIGERLVSTFSFATVANQSYFLGVAAIYSGKLVRTEVSSVNEPDGRRSIAQSRLVGTAPAVVIPPMAAPAVVTPPLVAPAPPVEPAVVAETPAVKPAAAPEVSAPAKPRRESAFALIASAGTFKLANESQTVAGFPSTYDTTSSSVFSIEAEWRSASGFAVGGEYFTYKNDLVSTATNPNAEQKVYAVMLNGKYYFQAADWFYPFVGVGVGQANASYSGGFTGNSSGFAYQGLAGAEIRFKSVGLSAQYKYLASEVGDSGRKVKVDGSGVLAGISISF